MSSPVLQVVCLGVLISGRADMDASVYGTLAAMAWLPVAAVYKVQWCVCHSFRELWMPVFILQGSVAQELECEFNGYDAPHPSWCAPCISWCGAWLWLAGFTSGSIAVQLALCPLIDPPGVLSYAWSTSAIFWISLSGLAAFFVNLSGFIVMGNLGAIAHVLLGQLKTCVIMLFAYFVFGTYYTTWQLLGALVAVAAILYYTHLTVHKYWVLHT